MIMYHAMTQVSLKQGLKRFKNKGTKAASKELLQIHLKKAFRSLISSNVNDQEKNDALVP